MLKISKEEAQVTAQHLLNRFDLADKRDEYPDRPFRVGSNSGWRSSGPCHEPFLMLSTSRPPALDPELVGEVLDAIKTLPLRG